MSKTTVWNVTPATQAQSSTVSLYGKTIAPGKSRKLDTSWIDLNPTPLQALQEQRMIHIGASLPRWYRKEKEDLMARYRLKNTTGSDKLLKADGFHPTIIRHGEIMPVDGDRLAKLDKETLEGLEVEDTGEDKSAEVPKEEPTKEEKPQEETKEKKPAKEEKKPKKRTTPKRGKKAAK